VQVIFEALTKHRVEVAGTKHKCMLAFYMARMKRYQRKASVGLKDVRKALANARVWMAHQVINKPLAITMDILKDFCLDIYRWHRSTVRMWLAYPAVCSLVDVSASRSTCSAPLCNDEPCIGAHAHEMPSILGPVCCNSAGAEILLPTDPAFNRLCPYDASCTRLVFTLH
jgi:hypothetical protein